MNESIEVRYVLDDGRIFWWIFSVEHIAVCFPRAQCAALGTIMYPAAYTYRQETARVKFLHYYQLFHTFKDVAETTCPMTPVADEGESDNYDGPGTRPPKKNNSLEVQP